MKEPTSRPCWICGAPADSDEHKHKRSDLVARYGRSWTPEQQPFVFRDDGSRWSRIQGPNDRKNFYEKSLCRRCNNARTKPFDQAYQEFSVWVLANATTLHGKEAIDFAGIYRGAYVEKSLDLLRYFAKSLGCCIADAGIDPPEALRRILTDVNRRRDTKPLMVTFGIDEFWHRVDPTGRAIGHDRLYNWPEITDRPRFSRVSHLGYLEICYWYDLEWEDGYPFGGEPICGPHRVVSLGRRDSRPDEPEASIKAYFGEAGSAPR
jgi:hypothetical protein